MPQKPFQRAVVIVDQLAHAHGQAGKRQFVPSEHKVVFARQFRQTFAGLQPFAHWVGHWLCRVDAEIRADRRKYLIARDDQIILATPERCMFRRVTIPDVDIP